jgi:hypothetical protein
MNIFGYMTMKRINFQEIFIMLQFNFWYFVHWEKRKKQKQRKTLLLKFAFLLLKYCKNWNLLFYCSLSALCFKVSIYQFCRKQLTKLANLLMHSQSALSEPISSSRKTRKLTVCPRKTWRKLWPSYISKFLTKMQIKFSIFFSS